MEEKGSFGKSTRRTGAARTRTQTPAKRENPTLDGFEAALKFDAENVAQKTLPTTQAANEITKPNAPSLTKEPFQVYLSGYSPDTQWAAINFYENGSGGMICEDYERNPPAERRRYASGLEYSSGLSRRALTKAEQRLAMQYQGGSSWIKVTFDSREAAERAMSYSPHLLHGYWVSAIPYQGRGPEVDEPVRYSERDHSAGALGATKPAVNSATLGSTFPHAAMFRTNSAPKQNATLPRSFATGQNAAAGGEEPAGVALSPASSTTASSATALAPENEGQIRQRVPESEKSVGQVKPAPTTFSHFPGVRRTELRPATEALLPQQSWWEALLKGWRASGWIPGDVIGSSVPRLENGDFDWANSSFYWRACYWLDCSLGSDLCGMKEG